jgi:hypothetical protein
VGITLGDHVLGGRRVFLEMIGLSVRVQGSGVVVDLEYEHMVLIVLRHRDVERVARALRIFFSAK